MGLFDKIRQKISEVMSFDEESFSDEGKAAEETADDSAKEQVTPEQTAPITDQQIVEQIADYLGGGGTVVAIGSAVLVPRYFTLFLNPDDARYWTGIEKVRTTLVKFLRKEIAGELTKIEGKDPVAPTEVHISIKTDDTLPAGKIEARGTIEKEDGFVEIDVPDEPELVPTPLTPPTAELVEPDPAVAGTEPDTSTVDIRLEVEGPGNRKTYQLPAPPVTVGRLTEGGLDIEDESQHFSRKHLEFAFDDAGLIVTLNPAARNPTSVDGEPLGLDAPVLVTNGTTITVAETRITVRISG
jgi:hypothetical protein